ncbi:hypothetical protein TSOC_014786, partial [Tetrabaena socialis]
ETLFEDSSSSPFKCESRHFNLIGFQVEVGLLLRVLKGAAANNAESVDFKLTSRQVAAPSEEQGTCNKPFLSLTAKVGLFRVTQIGGCGRLAAGSAARGGAARPERHPLV